MAWLKLDEDFESDSEDEESQDASDGSRKQAIKLRKSLMQQRYAQ